MASSFRFLWTCCFCCMCAAISDLFLYFLVCLCTDCYIELSQSEKNMQSCLQFFYHYVAERKLQFTGSGFHHFPTLIYIYGNALSNSMWYFIVIFYKKMWNVIILCQPTGIMKFRRILCRAFLGKLLPPKSQLVSKSMSLSFSPSFGISSVAPRTLSTGMSSLAMQSRRFFFWHG